MVRPGLVLVRQSNAQRTHLARGDRNTWARRHQVDPPELVTYTTVRALCGTLLGTHGRLAVQVQGDAPTCSECARFA